MRTRQSAKAISLVWALGLGVGCSGGTTSPAAAARPLPAFTANAAVVRAPASSTPKQAPAPTTTAPATPFPAGAIGGPGPLTLEAAAPNRSWVVFCQANQDTNRDGELSVNVGPLGELTGDTLNSYLALGNRKPERIDALWAHSGSRWLVVSKGGRATLVDASNNTRTDLSKLNADAREDRALFPKHRSFAFDRAGKSLAFAMVAPRRRFQVGHFDLARLSKQTWLQDAGSLWRTGLAPSGNWVIAQVIKQDTTGNGRLDWPVPVAGNKGRCTSPVQSHPAWLWRGDAPSTWVARLGSSRAKEYRDFAAPLGKEVLFRDHRGRLFLTHGKNKTLLAGKECGARIVHADSQRSLAIVGCAGPPTEKPPPRPSRVKKPRSDEPARSKRKKPPLVARSRWPLMLVGPGYSKDLELTLAPTGNDRWPGDNPRYVALHAGNTPHVVDLESKSVRALQPHDAVIATHGETLLVLRRGRILPTHAATLKPLAPSVMVDAIGDRFQNGRFVYVTPVIVDLSRKRVAGRVGKTVLALGADGLALIAHGADATPNQLAHGPLVWTAGATKN